MKWRLISNLSWIAHPYVVSGYLGSLVLVEFRYWRQHSNSLRCVSGTVFPRSWPILGDMTSRSTCASLAKTIVVCWSLEDEGSLSRLVLYSFGRNDESKCVHNCICRPDLTQKNNHLNPTWPKINPTPQLSSEFKILNQTAVDTWTTRILRHPTKLGTQTEIVTDLRCSNTRYNLIGPLSYLIQLQPYTFEFDLTQQ